MSKPLIFKKNCLNNNNKKDRFLLWMTGIYLINWSMKDTFQSFLSSSHCCWHFMFIHQNIIYYKFLNILRGYSFGLLKTLQQSRSQGRENRSAVGQAYWEYSGNTEKWPGWLVKGFSHCEECRQPHLKRLSPRSTCHSPPGSEKHLILFSSTRLPYG